jgi:predicted site-specific integrase-resolvase
MRNLLIAPPRLMRPGLAANELGVTTQTLANWADSGQLGCVRTAGGQRRYLATEIAAAAASRRPTEQEKVSA